MGCLILMASPVEACVGCREPGALTIAHESTTVLAGQGFSWSVLFMLGFVLAVVAGLSFFIWRTCQQLERGRVRS